MLFHTLDYLLFLPLCVLAYWAAPQRWRLGVLAVASVLFYASWSITYLPVLIGVVAVAWAGGLWLSRQQSTMGERVLVLGVLLLPLLFFKYIDWISWNAEQVAAWAGYPLALPRVDLPLPVGISFFTFQALAYVIDVARRRPEDTLGPERSLLRFGTYIAFFPQLVAGPIMRRPDLLPQLRSLPLLQRDQVGAGIYRIARGVFKKVLIADTMRVGMVDPVFSDPSRFTSIEVLFALYAYTLQIYCDFSGYTDIAIGSARLFGIELPENFRRPYKATCVAGFWRRWHITLSNWVRDYVYFPLGGSRVPGAGPMRVYFNIWLTLLIIGIWHGASWNFVIYGTLHGIAVGICRFRRKQTGRRPDDPLPDAWAVAWRWIGTFHFIVLARILFRAPDVATSWTLFAGLFDGVLVLPRFAPWAWAVFAFGYALHFSPSAWSGRSEAWFKRQAPLTWAVVAAAVAVACVWLGSGETLAFIYYQF